MRTPLLTDPRVLPLRAKIAQQLTASIQGIVVYTSGKPVSNAIVYVLPEQNAFRQIRRKADEQGRFAFKALPVGTIHVDAFRETDGFPYNFFAFFNQTSDTATKVEVRSGGPAPDVVVNLREKAAHLTINLTDTNGTAVKKPMRLIFSREDIPGHYQTAGTLPPHTMLVPCIPFSFSVEVEEYELWRSDRTTLRPGETLQLEAKLQTK